MSNGHAWSDIKKYTLSEVGVFVYSIYTKRELERIDRFSMEWMSNNLTQEGMESMVKNMSKTIPGKKVNKEERKKEVANEWMRLAAFQQ